MSKTDVNEMVNLCKGLGLQVQFESGLNHYSVRDPDSAAKLFYISSTPSDSNFKYEIARHLRRLGLLKGNLKFGKFKTITRKKKYGPVDLVALRKAQAMAESAGERIPLLEDLTDKPEFLRKSNFGTTAGGYTKDAMEEAIQSMTMKLTPRGNATKQRLRKFYDAHPGYKDSQFVRKAFEVGESRDLRVWPSLNAGQAAIGSFKREDDKTLQLWGMNLVEATLDSLEGMRWDQKEKDITQPFAPAITDEDVPPITHDYVTEETVGNMLENLRVQIEDNIMQKIQEDVFEGAPSNGNGSLRDRYAELLLVELGNPDSDLDKKEVMIRLDKLIEL